MRTMCIVCGCADVCVVAVCEYCAYNVYSVHVCGCVGLGVVSGE